MLTIGARTDWCDQPTMPRSHQTSVQFSTMTLLAGDVGPQLFTLFLPPEMLTIGAKTNWCDQPTMPRSHQTFHPVLAVKLLDEGLITTPVQTPSIHIFGCKNNVNSGRPRSIPQHDPQANSRMEPYGKFGAIGA
jgi:hypothetical protein